MFSQFFHDYDISNGLIFSNEKNANLIQNIGLMKCRLRIATKVLLANARNQNIHLSKDFLWFEIQ